MELIANSGAIESLVNVSDDALNVVGYHVAFLSSGSLQMLADILYEVHEVANCLVSGGDFTLQESYDEFTLLAGFVGGCRPSEHVRVRASRGGCRSCGVVVGGGHDHEESRQHTQKRHHLGLCSGNFFNIVTIIFLHHGNVGLRNARRALQ